MSGQRKVVYIAGYGRSGSTLLDLILGSLEGSFSVGELTNLWRTIAERQPCGCGEAIDDCQTWQAILGAVFSKAPRNVAREMRRLREHVNTLSSVPHHFSPLRLPKFEERADQFGRTLGKVYGAIHEETGSDWIVDSSKEPSSVFLLNRNRGLDPHVIHLVRDPRAVANSWTRKKRRPEVGDEEAYLPRIPPWRSARNWMFRNMAVEAGRRTGLPFLRVRYEDLAKTPREEVRRILRFLEGEDKAIPIEGDTLHPTRAHTVGGNPMRFDRGPTEIEPDESWAVEFEDRPRRVVEAITYPLRARYGYV